MSTLQEQRLVFCSAVAISTSGLVGFQNTGLPLNLQDFGNSGITQPRAFDTLGVECVWTGNLVGSIVVVGSISGVAAAMSPLSQPIGGSQDPDYSPIDDDLLFQTDQDGNVQVVPPQLPSQNLFKLLGTSGAGVRAWQMRYNPMNFIQLLVALNSGVGTLTCILSLRYQS